MIPITTIVDDIHNDIHNHTVFTDIHIGIRTDIQNDIQYQASQCSLQYTAIPGHHQRKAVPEQYMKYTVHEVQ